MTDGNSLKRKSNKNNVSNSNKHELPKALDGGFAWVVVAASFFIHLIGDGIMNSMGIIEPKLNVAFGESKTVTSWVLSIASGMTLCAGPIASLLVKKYGCRIVTIAGSILAAFSLFVSHFAKNVPTLIVTLGLGFGSALSFACFSAIVSVTTYFEKYRSLATGIAVSGAGVGTIVFPKLIKIFIDKYDWDGTCWILSGIVLNFAVCGALFRPLKASTREIPLTEQSDKYQRDETYEIELRRTSNSKLKSRASSLHMPSVNDREKAKSYQSNGKPVRTSTWGSISQPSINTDAKMSKISHIERNNGLLPNNANGTVSQPRFSYQGSLNSLSTQQTRSESAMDIDKYGTVQRTNENVNSNKKCCGCFSTDKFKKTIESMNFGLLKDPSFALFVISNFCTSIGFYIPIFCINQHLQGIGRDDGDEILMIYGVLNTSGRIITGYISDKSWVNRLWVYNCSLIACGIACVALVACWDFSEFAVGAAVIGFTISAYITLRSVILVDLLGLEKLESAFGLMLLFEGLATFIGPPICGFLYDQSASYTPGFIFAGTMIGLSGLILFPLPMLQKYIEKRQLRCGVEHIENIIAT